VTILEQNLKESLCKVLKKSQPCTLIRIIVTISRISISKNSEKGSPPQEKYWWARLTKTIKHI
jgi:hypothetical protein